MIKGNLVLLIMCESIKSLSKTNIILINQFVYINDIIKFVY